MIYFILYLIGLPLIPLWDAYIGFWFDFPEIEEGPNAVCAGILWPIALPILALIGFVVSFSRFCDKVRDKRLAREEIKDKQKRLRIAQEKKQAQDIEEQIQQLDKEMQAR